MRLSQLSYLTFEINAALDSGKHDGITIEEVEQRIENKEVIPWLRSLLRDEIDLSLFDAATINRYHDDLYDILGGYKGREARKWGVRNRGLCLLLAWTVELIQQKRWVAPGR